MQEAVAVEVGELDWLVERIVRPIAVRLVASEMVGEEEAVVIPMEWDLLFGLKFMVEEEVEVANFMVE